LHSDLPFVLSKENLSSANIAGWLLVAGAFAGGVWLMARKISQLWIRCFIRALAIAVAFTPTILFAPGSMTAMPVVPAWYAIWFGVTYTAWPFILFGVIPIGLLTCALWLFGMSAYGLRRLLGRRDAERSSTSHI
jgi:hypothetical protein